MIEYKKNQENEVIIFILQCSIYLSIRNSAVKHFRLTQDVITTI